MNWQQQIGILQKHLLTESIEGWLVYDFQKINPLGRQFLKISDGAHITRRIFYWIPQRGEPVKIVHAIETHVLDHLPGRQETYTSRVSLIDTLKRVLANSRNVAMEYSPMQEIPYLSKVDAGLVDLIRSFNLEVVSSGDLLQRYTSCLDAAQLASHLKAAAFLDHLAEKTWHKIRIALNSKEQLNEYQVQQWMFNEMKMAGFIAESPPICAVNAHSANPHYSPSAQGSAPICHGDFILIDLWCKEDKNNAVYADITRVAVAAAGPTSFQQQIFNVVREAQKAVTELVLGAHKRGEGVRGCDADQAARAVIAKAGYGAHFLHRTGHNIYTELHGFGAHLDSLETFDTRTLIPHTCFSVEPGIYLKEEFGIRLEYDIYLDEHGTGYVTGGTQESIATLC